MSGRRQAVSLLVLVFVLGALAVAPSPMAVAGQLQAFKGCTLVPNADNDGDSFIVTMDGKEQRVRIYFVDCPESGAATESDARRLREQRRYFGIESEATAVEYGRQARDLAVQVLREPFIVYTTFARAMGRAANPRIYAFVQTADGQDLATLLVQRGLGRAYGLRRETPEKLPAEEMHDRLRDMELVAMMKRIGIWAASDPDRLVALRAKQRAEDRELQQIQRHVGGAQGRGKGPAPAAAD